MRDRLLVLSRYTRLGASSRLRTIQYKPWLEDAGFEVEYSALFDDNYLKWDPLESTCRHASLSIL